MQGKSTQPKRKLPAGIELRHSRSCASRQGDRYDCDCDPAVRVFVYDRQTA
jgi:hypothetical protein